MMSSMDQVKEEEGGFEDDVSLSPASPPPVKAEDEDDDKYEDALDLDTAQMNSKVWLVRMPKFLMDQWRDIDQIGGRELGRVRIRQGPNEQWKVRLQLNDQPQTRDLPHNYDLSLVHQTLENTYVFKETELPKKKSDSQSTSASGNAGVSGSTLMSGPSEPRDYTPVVRNVLKRTALVGQAVHECVVTPDFKDPNYPNVIAKRKKLEQIKDPNRQVTLLKDHSGVGGLKYGASMRQQRSLIKTQSKRDMYRNGDGKATRIPKNELLDKLFKLFEELEFWPLKSLRERTRQPEQYLKEVLDNIAILHKKGPQANKYGLRDEFKSMSGSQQLPSEIIGNELFGSQSTPAPEMDDDDDDEMVDII